MAILKLEDLETVNKEFIHFIARDRHNNSYFLKGADQERSESIYGIVAEYIASNIAHFILEGRAPIVHLVADSNNQYYKASKAIPNYIGIKYFHESFYNDS